MEITRDRVGNWLAGHNLPNSTLFVEALVATFGQGDRTVIGLFDSIKDLDDEIREARQSLAQAQQRFAEQFRTDLDVAGEEFGQPAVKNLTDRASIKIENDLAMEVYPQEPQSELAGDPSDDPDRVVGTFMWADVALIYRLSGRLPTRTTEVRTVEARQDGVTRVLVGFRHKRTLDSGQMYEMRFEVEDGGLLERIIPARSGGFARAQIRLPGPAMRRGERRLLITSRHYVSGAEPPSWYYYYSDPAAPTRRLRLKVEFDLAVLPRRLWWYQNVSGVEMPADYTSKQAVSPNELGAVERVFEEPVLERFSGFRWEWE